jgi:hypothetical protein
MDETTNPAPEPVTESVADQPSATPPTDSSEKLLPQSEVNRLIANARREGREAALKTAKPTPAPQPAQQAASIPASAPDALAAMQSRLEEMELRLQFSPTAAKVGWDDTQSATMFDLFKAQRPQDPTDWFSRMDQMFPGSRKQATPSPVTPAIQTPATPPATKPNISDRGTASPADLRDSEGVLNTRPLEMNAHDVDTLILKHGHAKGMQMFQEHVLRALGGVKLKSPRG